MTKEQYHEDLALKASKVLRTLREKGEGYNPTEGDEFDPFYNYALGGELAGVTQEQAMISRIGEKLVRLGTLIKHPSRKTSETMSETAQDIVGISLMLWKSTETLAEAETEESETTSTPEVTTDVVTKEEESPLVSEELVEKSPAMQLLMKWIGK